MKNIKNQFIIPAITVSLIATFILIVSSGSASATLTSRSPIYIGSDSEFTLANGVASGSGIESDPYVIENWVIDAGYSNGIYIKDTTAHFVIRNCVVENSLFYSGIYLENVEHGRIENCLSNKSYYGFFLDDSDNITLVSNIAHNGPEHGFILISSDNNTLMNNQANKNRYGFFLDDSDNNTLMNNQANNNDFNGFYLDSSDNNTLKSNIVENNHEDGVLIEYSDNNTLVNNVVESNNWGGFYLYYSNNNTLTNNRSENNEWEGLLLQYSNNNILVNNIVEKNAMGFFIYDSDNNTLMSNVVENNNLGGFHIRYSNNNTLMSNLAKNNSDGFYLLDSDNNTLMSNVVENNDSDGFVIYDSSNILIENSVADNNETGVWIYGDLSVVDNVKIVESSIVNNYIGIKVTGYTHNIVATLDNIVNNENYGLLHDPAGPIVITVIAENNCWGDPTGPSGVGPGSGDAVSLYVDYDPWLPCGAVIEPEVEEYDLYADQNVKVGTISVWNDCENLYVKYALTEDNWYLMGIHLDVDNSENIDDGVDDVPQTKKGNPMPGLFTYAWENNQTLMTEYTMVFSLENLSENVLIAAQAEVENHYWIYDFVEETDVLVKDEETTWAATAPGENRFVDKGNWATYVEYGIKPCSQ